MEQFKGFQIQSIIGNENGKVSEWEQKIKEREAEVKYNAYINSGVPERYFNESIESFTCENEKMQEIKNKVQKFAENPKNKILVLYGENGNGKTHLGAGIVRACGGEYILSSLLCVKYDSGTSFKASMTREEILEHYSKVKMLVIDECCKYFINAEMEKFVLSYIISMRYANGLPTVLITNGKINDFINFLGKAVYDRFTEVCTTLEFDWQSKRKELRDKNEA